MKGGFTFCKIIRACQHFKDAGSSIVNIRASGGDQYGGNPFFYRVRNGKELFPKRCVGSSQQCGRIAVEGSIRSEIIVDDKIHRIGKLLQVIQINQSAQLPYCLHVAGRGKIGIQKKDIGLSFGKKGKKHRKLFLQTPIIALKT